jgi:N-carbamoylputrescine amidase
MASERKFKVGLIQMSVERDAQENLRRAVVGVEEAARKGAGVICLPELFRSRYFCQSEDAANFDLAETVPGPSTEALGEVARKTGAAIVAPIFERRAPGL